MKEYKTKEYSRGFSNVVRLGLERIEMLLDLLGNPEDKLKFVHVAGTNGKGSVCAFVEAGLAADGKKVGKFTSPNLVKVNERIVVDRKDISDAELERVLEAVNFAAEKVKAVLGEEPTQFEIWTAAALYYFAEAKCDIVVLEVGLGGEFDATNIIKSPEIAVICHIDIDHTAYLGNSISEIAKAKCGIIKPDITTGTVVSAEQCDEAKRVIEETAEKYGHKVVFAPTYTLKGYDDVYEIFNFDGVRNIRLSLGGVYQIMNASLAVEVLKALEVAPESIREGLETAVHRARFEKLSESLIFDGGHNPDGIKALNNSLDRYFNGRNITIIFACMADKDIKTSLELLSGEGRSFVFTTVSDNPRAMTPEALKAYAAENCGIDGISAPGLKDAIKLAEARKELTVICGSLYLYGDLF